MPFHSRSTVLTPPPRWSRKGECSIGNAAAVGDSRAKDEAMPKPVVRAPMMWPLFTHDHNGARGAVVDREGIRPGAQHGYLNRAPQRRRHRDSVAARGEIQEAPSPDRYRPVIPFEPSRRAFERQPGRTWSVSQGRSAMRAELDQRVDEHSLQMRAGFRAVK